MRTDRTFIPAPLFDRTADGRAFVPTKARLAGARGGGPGRPSGRRVRALPWRAASPPARWFGVGIVGLILGLGAPGAGRAAEPAAPPDLEAIITEAAQRFDLPASWIGAVMRVESAFDPQARSPAGAIGLMQVMPRTYAQLRDRYGLGADAYRPRDNILAGAAYLREMYDRFGAPGFLAAYNAGPARYADHLGTGRPLPMETRVYVAALVPRILGEISGVPRSAMPRPTLFVPLHDRSTALGRAAQAVDSASPSPLFAPLTPREPSS